MSLDEVGWGMWRGRKLEYYIKRLHNACFANLKGTPESAPAWERRVVQGRRRNRSFDSDKFQYNKMSRTFRIITPTMFKFVC